MFENSVLNKIKDYTLKDKALAIKKTLKSTNKNKRWILDIILSTLPHLDSAYIEFTLISLEEDIKMNGFSFTKITSCARVIE